MISTKTGICLALAFAVVLHGPSARGVVVDLPQDDEEAAQKKRVGNARVHDLDKVIQSRVPDSEGFPFWKHIGMVGMGSGVYLGDGFVMTCAHVGCYPFRMADGSYYKPDYKSWRVLENDGGNSPDIAIYRVSYGKDSSLAELGRLPIASSTPMAQATMLLCGAGLSQKSDPSALRSNGRILSVLGYGLQAKRETTWGFNSLSEVPEDLVVTGDCNTHCFVTRFDRSGFEAQAAAGDSGGASFVFNSRLKRWELAGCIIGVTQKGSYVPLGSRTFLANLSVYRSQFPLQEAAIDVVDADTTEVPVDDEVSLDPIGREETTVRPAVVVVEISDC